MTWLRVDDQIPFAASTIAAGNAAIGAWVRMSAWSSAQLADGVVPRAVALTMATSRELASLVAAGLVCDHGGTYEILGYLDTNLSRDQVLQNRADLSAKRAEAGRAGGLRSAEVRRSKAEANGEATAKQVASGLLDADRSPFPSLPVPSEHGEDLPAQPLALTSPEPRRRKAKSEASPEHRELVAHFVALFEQLKGCEPEIVAKDHVAVNRLLANGRSLADAKAILDRAFGTDFVRTEKPDLAFIAGNVNAYLGATVAKATGKPGALVQRDTSYAAEAIRRAQGVQ